MSKRVHNHKGKTRKRMRWASKEGKWSRRKRLEIHAREERERSIGKTLMSAQDMVASKLSGLKQGIQRQALRMQGRGR
jgi:hypothetical protein